MAEKKKILYIVEAMGGGVFTYIVELANELVNKYDMYIAYAVRKQTPKNYKDYFDKRIHLIEVKNFGRAIDPVKDIAALFEVKKIAAKIKPDVIHLHSSKAGAIGRVAFNGKIPMFYTPHGYSFLMENYKPMKRRMFKLIESVCAKRNCTTISCSVGEHQESLKLTKHATYVNNGINMAELQEIIDKTEKVEHSFTVYTLGRICYQKNPTLFNEIAESLPDVKFVWIGDGELRDQLTSENIEITGWADRSTAIRYAVNAPREGNPYMQEKQSVTVRCMDIEDLEKQAEAIRVEQIKLYESYADGVLRRDAYIEKKKILSEKLVALQDSIRTEKEEQECADELDEEIRALTKQASEKTYIGGLTKECVDAFVSMVYLYDDQTMKIEFNCEDVIRRALEKYGA